MFATLNSINAQDFNDIKGITATSIKKTQNCVNTGLLANKGKLVDRVIEAKTKKEKTLVIKEWVMDEVKKINKASEMEDF